MELRFPQSIFDFLKQNAVKILSPDIALNQDIQLHIFHLLKTNTWHGYALGMVENSI